MLYFSSTIPKMMLQQWSNGKKIQMNCYSAHLSIDVHSSLKQKKYIYFIQLDLIVSIFLFILSNLIIHSLSFSLSLSRSSLIPLKLHSLNIVTIVKLTPVRYNLLLFSFFLFFFILSNPVSFTLSHSLSSLISSLSSSLSQRRRLDHRQHRRPGLTLSTPITDPQSSPPIGVPDWETHGDRH